MLYTFYANWSIINTREESKETLQYGARAVGPPKTGDILPRGVPSKRLRYGEQIKILKSVRLLLLKVLHGGEILKNQDFRKYFTDFSQ